MAGTLLKFWAFLKRDFLQSFPALAGATHQFTARRRRMADPAFYFHADDVEFSSVS